MSAKDITYGRYIKDISQFPGITKERENALTRIISKGRKKEYIEAAVDELVKANLRLVVHCVKSFSCFLYNCSSSITAMDLISEGNLALVKAARNFDPSYQTGEHAEPIRFSAYACQCIKNAMRKAFRKATFIHIPDHHYGYWKKIKELREVHKDDIDDSLLEKELDIASSLLKTIKLGMESSTIMLEDFKNADGDSNWHDIIADEHAIDPQNVTSSKDMRSYLSNTMTAIPPRTREMMTMMFFEERKPTLHDLSVRFGVSKERCRQICAKGLQLLKVHMQTTLDGIEQVDFFGTAQEMTASEKMPAYLQTAIN